MDAMTTAIRAVGNRFSTGELGLPDLIGAAEAMQSAMPILEREIKRHREEVISSGTVVIGTVRGDIHTVGKALVVVLLRVAGFKVYDLGVDVKTEQFIEGIDIYRPNILAMSTLMTTTVRELEKVIDNLEKNGIRDRVKVMVGGGAVTEKLANHIGADGYAATATGAVEVAKLFASDQSFEISAHAHRNANRLR